MSERSRGSLWLVIVPLAHRTLPVRLRLMSLWPFLFRREGEIPVALWNRYAGRHVMSAAPTSETTCIKGLNVREKTPGSPGNRWGSLFGVRRLRRNPF